MTRRYCTWSTPWSPSSSQRRRAYAALKLEAWLDRSATGGYRDAVDIATIIYWYAKSTELIAYLYDDPEGQVVLIDNG